MEYFPVFKRQDPDLNLVFIYRFAGYGSNPQPCPWLYRAHLFIPVNCIIKKLHLLRGFTSINSITVLIKIMISSSDIFDTRQSGLRIRIRSDPDLFAGTGSLFTESRFGSGSSLALKSCF